MLLTPSIFLRARRTAKLQDAQLSPSTGMITFESAAAFALCGALPAALTGETAAMPNAAAARSMTIWFFIWILLGKIVGRVRGAEPLLQPLAVGAEYVRAVFHCIHEGEQRSLAVVLLLPFLARFS